jgi:hypothetical protein
MGDFLALYGAAIYLIYLPFCMSDKVFNLVFSMTNSLDTLHTGNVSFKRLKLIGLNIIILKTMA